MHLRLTALLFACGMAFGRMGAQTPPSQPEISPTVSLDVVVSQGKHGPLVGTLPESSFTVLDNGVPEAITSFRAVSSQTAPVHVIIVVDDVNLNFQNLTLARQQLEKFLRSNNGQLAEPTALAIFTDTQTRIQPTYSTNGNAIADTLDRQLIGYRALERSAGFFGAEERLQLSLRTSANLLTQLAGQPGRKLVIWLSPGWPLLSNASVQITSQQRANLFQAAKEFNTLLRKSRTTMYVVDPRGTGESPGALNYFEYFTPGLKNASGALPGNLGAQVLSVQSGGLFLGANNDVSTLLQTCYADATRFYEISFRPSQAQTAEAYHQIEVRVAEPLLVARTLHGYYSTASGSPAP